MNEASHFISSIRRISEYMKIINSIEDENKSDFFALGRLE